MNVRIWFSDEDNSVLVNIPIQDDKELATILTEAKKVGFLQAPNYNEDRVITINPDSIAYMMQV